MPCRLFRGLLLAVALAGLVSAVRAAPPEDRVAALRRGINITGWFRYPVSRSPDALRRYMSDEAMRALARAGFTWVRLAVDPALLEDSAALPPLREAVQRLRRAGLAVVVSLHPAGWRLEDEPDQQRLFAAWRTLAPSLRGLDPAGVMPELVNEPVFPRDPAGWQSLQQRLLLALRASLRQHTIVLTGHLWGSIDGLLALAPVADPNVVYSFHFYDPAELTALAPWRPELDRAALSRLPFPIGDRAACEAAAGATDAATRGMIAWYCASGWDAERLASRIGPAASWAVRHRVALLAGEFGASATLNPRARLAWLAAARSALEAERIGWALWGYDDIMGYAVPRPPGASPRLDPEVSRALGLRTEP